MAVLEALSKFNNSHEDDIDLSVNNEPQEDGSPEVYVRPNKEKELDLLWKDFRIPKGERSPIVYLGIGFVSGVVATLLVSACIGMSSGNFHVKSNTSTPAEVVAPAETQQDVSAETTAEVNQTEETSKGKKFGLFGNSNNTTETASTEIAAQTKEYEVQSGDTMEKIVKQFYGSYSGDKVEAIMNANNMSDANKLSIGQKLIIPIETSANAE